MIGKEAVLGTDAPDGEVWVAVRPEGFVIDENGPLTCALNRVEVMGRDVSVVSGHPDCENASIRAIVSAEDGMRLSGASVRFALKTNKVFVFDKATEKRIDCRLG